MVSGIDTQKNQIVSKIAKQNCVDLGHLVHTILFSNFRNGPHDEEQALPMVENKLFFFFENGVGSGWG